MFGSPIDYTAISFGVRIETQLTICGNYIGQLTLLNCSMTATAYCHTDMVSNCKQGDGRVVPFLPYIWSSAARQLGLTNGQLMWGHPNRISRKPSSEHDIPASAKCHVQNMCVAVHSELADRMRRVTRLSRSSKTGRNTKICKTKSSFTAPQVTNFNWLQRLKCTSRHTVLTLAKHSKQHKSKAWWVSVTAFKWYP